MKYLLWLTLFISGSCVAQSPKQSQEKEINQEETSSPDPAKESLIQLTLPDGRLVGTIEKEASVWQSELSEKEFYVLREKGTERAFTGSLLKNKEEGVYTCNACGFPLFNSKTKYKSGTGWPSYFDPIQKEYIREETDYVLGYARTEVMCNRCGGHLGHVFKDGPPPTGLRYCINSISLDFVKQGEFKEYLNTYK